jgi:C1A family cysteine protease
MVFNFFFLFATLLICRVCSINPKYDEEWSNWFKKYRSYGRLSFNFSTELLQRRSIWEERHLKILKHNEEVEQGKHTYKMGHNEFSDLTFEEFTSKFLGAKAPTKKLNQEKNTIPRARTLPIPQSKDWRLEGTGYVNPVRDQASCGCCWAFAACGAIEGAYFKATQIARVMSPQQLVDCDHGNDNFGCGGGMPERAFQYFIRHGILTESEYPYISGSTGTPGACKYNASMQPHTIKMTGWSYTSASSFTDESALTEAIANIGPVAVAIYVTDEFQSYQSGVFSENACKVYDASGNPSINHAVIAVGFGTDLVANKDYYILKVNCLVF